MHPKGWVPTGAFNICVHQTLKLATTFDICGFALATLSAGQSRPTCSLPDVIILSSKATGMSDIKNVVGAPTLLAFAWRRAFVWKRYKRHSQVRTGWWLLHRPRSRCVWLSHTIHKLVTILQQCSPSASIAFEVRFASVASSRTSPRATISHDQSRGLPHGIIMSSFLQSFCAGQQEDLSAGESPLLQSMSPSSRSIIAG